MKSLKIREYEVQKCSRCSDIPLFHYEITKNGKAIAYLKEDADHYSAYVIDAGGSINYEKKTKNKKPFGTISFLTNVVNDIEDYYERSRCFI